MKIPNKVKVGAHSYNIVFRDDLDDDNFGTCRPKKLRIFIDETAEKTQQEETFFHEVMHAIFHQVGMSTPWDMDKEERRVQALGHSIYQVLKENRLLK